MLLIMSHAKLSQTHYCVKICYCESKLNNDDFYCEFVFLSGLNIVFRTLRLVNFVNFQGAF